MDIDRNKYLRIPLSVGKKQLSERGDLVCYFRDTVNEARIGTKYPKLRIGFFAKKLQGIPTKDLYALKSKMEDGERRNIPASAIFFLELKPSEDYKEKYDGLNPKDL